VVAEGGANCRGGGGEGGGRGSVEEMGVPRGAGRKQGGGSVGGVGVSRREEGEWGEG